MDAAFACIARNALKNEAEDNMCVLFWGDDGDMIRCDHHNLHTPGPMSPTRWMCMQHLCHGAPIRASAANHHHKQYVFFDHLYLCDNWCATTCNGQLARGLSKISTPPQTIVITSITTLLNTISKHNGIPCYTTKEQDLPRHPSWCRVSHTALFSALQRCVYTVLISQYTIQTREGFARPETIPAAKVHLAVLNGHRRTLLTPVDTSQD